MAIQQVVVQAYSGVDMPNAFFVGCYMIEFLFAGNDMFYTTSILY